MYQILKLYVQYLYQVIKLYVQMLNIIKIICPNLCMHQILKLYVIITIMYQILKLYVQYWNYAINEIFEIIFSTWVCYSAWVI